MKKETLLIGIYSYHTDAIISQVIDDVAKEKNVSQALATNYVYSSGLTIYSTQNTDMQIVMEEEFKNEKYIKESTKQQGATSQAAIVIINQSNGFVLSCVGALGEKKTSRGLNRATQAVRQTGSSMKPLAVVGPALQEGLITPASVFSDVQTTFKLANGETYRPKNYNRYRGNITVRQALETSQNIPFIKIMEKLTPEKSREYLIKMGITSLTKNDYGLALAIGGLDEGISPLEMAGAYATIANDGVYIEPTFYTKVKDLQGNIVLEANQKSEQVYSKQVAYILKDLLTQPVKGKNGTATYCAIEGIDVAAKTGTTNDDYDRWLCGFTPYCTAACWYGYDYNETIIFSKNPAAVIWSSIMSKIHLGMSPAKFEKPEGVISAKICKTSGKLATKYCWNTATDLVVEGTPYCDQHKGYYQKTNTQNTETTTKTPSQENSVLVIDTTTQ